MAELSTQIKDALKKAGLDEDLADQIKVTKEEEIAGAIEKLKKDIEEFKDMSPEDFKTAIESAGLSEPLKRHIDTETSKRVTKILKNRDIKVAEEAAEQVATEVETEAQKGMTEDQKTIAAQGKMIKEQGEKIDTLVEKTSKKDVSTAVIEALQEKKLDEGFAKYINVATVEEVGDAVKDFSDRLLSTQQKEIDKQLEEGGLPAKGDAETSSSSMESAVEAYANKQNKADSEGGLIKQQLQGTEAKK